MMRDRLSIVAGLSDADMVWLLSIGKLRSLRAEEHLVAPGRAVHDLFFVIHGRLEVRQADGTHIATLGEGEVVGEMSFVDRRPPSVVVQADGASEILAVPRQMILDRFEREPVFAARFYRALAVFLSDRLRETTAAVRAHGEDGPQPLPVDHGERFRGLVRMFRGRPG